MNHINDLEVRHSHLHPRGIGSSYLVALVRDILVAHDGPWGGIFVNALEHRHICSGSYTLGTSFMADDSNERHLEVPV